MLLLAWPDYRRRSFAGLEAIAHWESILILENAPGLTSPFGRRDLLSG